MTPKATPRRFTVSPSQAIMSSASRVQASQGRSQLRTCRRASETKNAANKVRSSGDQWYRRVKQDHNFDRLSAPGGINSCAECLWDQLHFCYVRPSKPLLLRLL